MFLLRDESSQADVVWVDPRHRAELLNQMANQEIADDDDAVEREESMTQQLERMTLNCEFDYKNVELDDLY